MIFKNFLPLAPLPIAALLSIVHSHQSEIVASIASNDTVASEAQKYFLTDIRPALISEPHKHFPDEIRRIVEAANAISPDAIELPDNHPYPVIDISSWMDPSESSEEDRQNIVSQVLKEARTNGSFNIVGHGIKDDLFDRLYSSAAKFFAMSVEEKLQYSYGNNLAGYVANRNESVASLLSGTSKEQKDLRETFSMSYPPNYDGNVQGPQDFYDVLSEYIEQLQPVTKAVKEICTAALGSAKGIDLPTSYLQDLEVGSTGLLRASRYPSTPGFDDTTKLMPHSDFGTVTIISGREEGLEEVRDGRWYKVPMKNNELHVNLGQMYAMVSNGLFQHNIHRVSKEAMKDRISFPYFASQGRNSKVGAGMSPVCSDGELAKFPQVSTVTHLRQYIDLFTGGKGELWDDRTGSPPMIGKGDIQ